MVVMSIIIQISQNNSCLKFDIKFKTIYNTLNNKKTIRSQYVLFCAFQLRAPREWECAKLEQQVKFLTDIGYAIQKSIFKRTK